MESTWQRWVARKSDADGRSEARQEATIRARCGGSPSMWERPGVGGLQRSLRASSMHNDDSRLEGMNEVMMNLVSLLKLAAS